ncbi:MAG: transposase [Methylocapsa sp.]|nr:transposase [Methylocapsa sp.]
MLSTIVLCEDSPSGRAGADIAVMLARTLASLVPAKIDGVLYDVKIAGPAKAGLGFLANHAGCALIEAHSEEERLKRALKEARGPNVFLLRCGQAPEPGFAEEVHDFLAQNSAACLRPAQLRAAPESILERLFPSLAPVAGIIALRESLLSAPCGGFRKLTGSIGPAIILRTRARFVG